MTSALVIELDCLADTRVIELVKDLDRQHNDLRRTLVIVVVTSRPDTEYAQVADWLDSQGVPADLVLTKDPTLTRGEGSPITDGEFKHKLYQFGGLAEFDVWLVLDCRSAPMWRALGLTCLDTGQFPQQ